MTLKATTTMMMRTRRKTRENDDDDEEDYWYRALKNNNNKNNNMSNDDANTNIATGRLQLASLGLRKIPESLSSSFVVGVGKIQILDVSGNVFRDAVRFFSSPNDASKYPQSYSQYNHSLLSNVRCLNVSKNKHLTGILDLHLFKNLKYLDASETRIGKSVRKGETVLPKRLERVKLDACGWLGGGELEEKEIQEIERENLFAKRATGGEKAILLPNLTHVSLENNGLGPDVPDLTTTGLFANAQCLNLKNNAISSLSKAQERMRYMERLTSPRTIFPSSPSFGSSATNVSFHVSSTFVWRIIRSCCGRSITSTITSPRSHLLSGKLDDYNPSMVRRCLQKAERLRPRCYFATIQD